MEKTKIKLCGMFRPEDIGFVNEVQPDFCGFILAEGFRRHISRRQAAAFRRALSPGIPAVGVFVDAPWEEVASFLEEGVIQMAQLHGRETEEEIRRIRQRTGKPVIKAVKVERAGDVEAWLDSEADYLLFDAGTGSGKQFDWSLLQGVDRAFFLAGGLKAENLAEAMDKVTPFAVDLSSGVETDGVKDLAKMREAVRIVRERGK